MSFPYFVKLIKNHKKYVLAYSGGLDSTVLLHQLMYWYSNKIRVLHVHHGLSVNADSWALHCQNICQKWQVPYDILYIKVHKSSKGTEASAREERYRVLFNNLKIGECLLTAHHRDDQCETVLLALKRGSGPAGLSAMPSQSYRNGYLHLRPLLNYTRKQLEFYAIEQKLSWIEDESNADIHHDRNFLRLHVLPILQNRWKFFSTTVARSAELCAQQEKALDELLIEKLEKIIDKDGSLHFTSLLTMNEACRNAILRRWIILQGGIMPIPSLKIIKRIMYEIMLSKKDAHPRLRIAQMEIRRYRKKLYLLPILNSLKEYKLIWYDTKIPLLLPQNLGQLKSNNDISELRKPQHDEQITIRFGVKGYYHIIQRSGGCKIKKIWQELGIPIWEREKIPLIYYNEILIGAPQLFTTHDGAVKKEKGWQVLWTNC